jgi:2-polyprenyl-6-methoxyphenol hydroxylase-like FAD-dependent oxidoreductase
MNYERNKMALPAQKVLIIGGGFSGMAAAIRLQMLGASVELVEIDKDWRTDGAGITVSGPSLRALESIGILPQFYAQGASTNGVDMFNVEGSLLKSIPTPRPPDSEVVGAGGIMRPVLASILAKETRNSGVQVRLGLTFTSIEEHEDAISVAFSDGSQQTYDLVIAADGVLSSVRKSLFIDAPMPQYTGQGVWRAVVPRFGTERSALYLGARSKSGFTPVSAEQMYLHFTEHRPGREHIPEQELLPRLKALLEEYKAPVMVKVREQLNESSQILYRPLEAMLMPRPWYRGRLLLIGDSVHATTPHLASGAGMGFEDAVVLGEEFARGGDLQAVLERYQNRRWERCRMIVTNSSRLGEIEMQGGLAEEHGQIMSLSLAALQAPI